MTASFLLSIFTLACLLHAQTNLSGDIGDATLQKEGNPYIINDNLTILSDQTVTIKEGCVFLFQPFAGIIINGSLHVEGTRENPVMFVSVNDPTYNPESPVHPNPFDWNGILLTLKTGEAHLSNFILKHSVYGIKSPIDNLVIENGIFSQNGQFNLAVKDVLLPVVENIPFSYNVENNQNTNTPVPAKPRKRKVLISTGVSAVAIAIAIPVAYFLLTKKTSPPDSSVITIN